MDYFTKISFGDGAVIQDNLTSLITDQFATYGASEFPEYVRDGGDVYWTSDVPVPDEVWESMKADPANPVLDYRTWQTSADEPQWYTKITFGNVPNEEWIELAQQTMDAYNITYELTENEGTDVTWATSAIAGCAA